jgi:hypothetical protein
LEVNLRRTKKVLAISDYFGRARAGSELAAPADFGPYPLLEVLRTMTGGAVGLAFVADNLSYYSYGYCLHAIVNLHE